MKCLDLFFLTFLTILVACNSDEPKPNIPNLRELSVEEQELVNSINDFSFEIFSRVNASYSKKNIFISPFSINAALSMTLNGAEGETLDSMKKAIRQENLEIEEMNESYKSLVEFLFNLDRTVTFEVANSNWYRNELEIRKSFEKVLLEYYDAYVRSADFSDAGTVDKINSWIEGKTHGKIQDMLDRIPDDAIMYLINAVYFKADWKYQFDKNATSDRPFTLQDGTAIQTPTMFAEEVTITSSSNGEIDLYNIPYGNGQFNFMIIMPRDRQKDINEVAEELTTEQIRAMLQDTVSGNTELYLPKFKMEFKEENLKNMLSDMGMGIAFSDNAKFSLFEDDIPAAISNVIHQSFLEVNEEGSEAAAATLIEFVETSIPQPRKLEINRPFLFYIREQHSGLILFTGKIVNPGTLQ